MANSSRQTITAASGPKSLNGRISKEVLKRNRNASAFTVKKPIRPTNGSEPTQYGATPKGLMTCGCKNAYFLPT